VCSPSPFFSRLTAAFFTRLTRCGASDATPLLEAELLLLLQRHRRRGGGSGGGRRDGRRRVAHGDPEVGGEAGEAGVVALADRPELPLPAAQVELAEHEGGLGARVGDVEAGQLAPARRVVQQQVQAGTCPKVVPSTLAARTMRSTAAGSAARSTSTTSCVPPPDAVLPTWRTAPSGLAGWL
jgi:hypothetical protein